MQNDVAAITGIYENAESFWEHRVKNAHKRADTCTICICSPTVDPSVPSGQRIRSVLLRVLHFALKMLFLKKFIISLLTIINLLNDHEIN